MKEPFTRGVFMDTKKIEARFSALAELIVKLHTEVRNNPAPTEEVLMDNYYHFMGLAKAYREEVKSYQSLIDACPELEPTQPLLYVIWSVPALLECTSNHLREDGERLNSNLLSQLVSHTNFKGPNNHTVN